MSSTHSHAPLQQQVPSFSVEPTVAKKKFGKNLNKLTKPPAPPISGTSSAGGVVTGGGVGVAGSSAALRSSTSTSSTSSSRSGLLLLSTKRSSTTSVSSTSGGLLSTKPSSAPRPLNTLSLKSESFPKSAHDALLTAAAAAAGRVAPPPPVQQQPAWGLAEKTQTRTSTQPPAAPAPAPILAPKGGVSAGYHAAPPSSLHDASSDRSQSGTTTTSTTGGTRPKNSGVRGRQAYLQRPALPQEEVPEKIDDAEVPIAENIDTRNRVQTTVPTRPTPRSTNSYTRSRSASSGNSSDTPPQHIRDPPTNGKATDEGSLEDPNENPKALNTEPERTTDEQVKFMSRLAKERAEKRRAEEEARMKEQREGAKRRLKELETKMNSSTKDVYRKGSAPESAPKTSSYPVAPKSNWRQPNPKRASLTGSEIVLERLGRTTKNSTAGMSPSNMGGSSTKPSGNNGGRTLFDPTRTYSSLVGGSPAPRMNVEDATDKKLNQQHMMEHLATGAVSLSRDSVPHFQNNDINDIDDQHQPPITMIQLSSYEDRDRGERGSGAGPRMLFDPKSGSMVAAPSREDTNTGGKGGRKERIKQKNRTNRNDREKDSHDSSVPVQAIAISKRADSDRDRGYNGNNGVSVVRRTNGADDSGAVETVVDGKLRRARGRKEESTLQRKDRKRNERETKNQWSESPASSRSDYNDTAKPRQGGVRNGNTRQSRQALPTDQMKIPRTCGVLYKMDEKGSYICADGCEADQGYGAHSVPGGRVRNPAAHAIFVQQQQRLQEEVMPSSVEEMGDMNLGHEDLNTNPYIGATTVSDQYQDETNVISFDAQFGKYRWQQEHQPELFEKQQQRLLAEASSALLDNDNQTRHQGVPTFGALQAEESIDILSGTQESVNVQALHNLWAPTEAVLAAAAAAAAAAKTVSHEVVLEDSSAAEIDDPATAADLELIINDDEDDDSDGEHGNLSYFGLGFDPTENMDSVMMSPSLRSNVAGANDDPLNLANLSLDATGVTETGNGSNPFGQLGTPSSFLGSSTWGASGAGGVSIGGLANWDFNANSDSIPVSAEVPTDENRQQSATATSFLSLNPLPPVSNEGTWGTGGLVGGLSSLGRTPFGNTQSNAKNTGHEND